MIFTSLYTCSPPEKSVIVTHDEKDSFKQVCQKIEEVVTHKLKHFRTCFPFASPKDDLKVTIKLFDLVCLIHASQLLLKICINVPHLIISSLHEY